MIQTNPTSRGISGLICGLVAGGVSGALLNFALGHAGSVLVLLSYITAVPLFMAGMGAGVLSGALAAVVGAAGLFLFAPGSFAFFYTVADAAPAILLTALAMRMLRGADGKLCWADEAGLLAALAIYPCVVFLVIFGLTAAHPGGLLAMTTDAMGDMTAQISDLLSQNGEKITPEITVRIDQYVHMLARLLPALGMCTWLLVTMIAMAAAQGILRQQKWALRPPFALAQLRVPTWIIFAAAISGILAVYAPPPADYVGLNIAVVLVLPFFFVGLAVIHAWAATTRAPTAVLILFYILIGVIVHLVLLVAMLGAVDQWVDFRKRFADKTLTKNQGERK